MLKTTGRTDIEEMFKLSNMLTLDDLVHHPIMAFIQHDDELHVCLFSNARGLLKLEDDTPVMWQWPGKWRSDWFQMTVGDVRAALQRKDGA